MPALVSGQWLAPGGRWPGCRHAGLPGCNWLPPFTMRTHPLVLSNVEVRWGACGRVRRALFERPVPRAAACRLSDKCLPPAATARRKLMLACVDAPPGSPLPATSEYRPQLREQGDHPGSGAWGVATVAVPGRQVHSKATTAGPPAQTEAPGPACACACAPPWRPPPGPRHPHPCQLTYR